MPGLRGGRNSEPRTQCSSRAGVGTVAVIAIYGLLNLLYLYVLPVGQLAQVKGSVLDVIADRLLGTRAGNVMGIVSIISIAASISAMTFAGPRVYYAMARTACSCLRPRGCIRVQDPRGVPPLPPDHPDGRGHEGAALHCRHPRDAQAGGVGGGAEELRPHRVRGDEHDSPGVATRSRRACLRHLSQRVEHQSWQVQGRAGGPAPRAGPDHPGPGQADRNLPGPPAPHGGPGLPDLSLRLGCDGSAARHGEGLPFPFPGPSREAGAGTSSSRRGSIADGGVYCRR